MRPERLAVAAMLSVVAATSAGCGVLSGGADSGAATVVYEVSGAAKARSITYSIGGPDVGGNDADNKVREQAVELPWTKTVRMAGSLNVAVLNVQNDSDGIITCKITVNGEVVKQTTSPGQYSIANCSTALTSPSTASEPEKAIPASSSSAPAPSANAGASDDEWESLNSNDGVETNSFLQIPSSIGDMEQKQQSSSPPDLEFHADYASNTRDAKARVAVYYAQSTSGPVPVESATDPFFHRDRGRKREGVPGRRQEESGGRGRSGLVVLRRLAEGPRPHHLRDAPVRAMAMS